MKKFWHRFFVSGIVRRPAVRWVTVAAIITLILVAGITRMEKNNYASKMALVGNGTDLVLRIRGLPYPETANRYGNPAAMSEAQLLIRTRLLTGDDGVSKLLIDTRLVSSDGQTIWSSTKISENTELEFVQEEIGRTLAEAMKHVGVDGDRISI